MNFDNEVFLKNLEKATQMWPQVLEKFNESTAERMQNNEPLTREIGEAFWEFQQQLMQQKPELLASQAMNWWQQSIEANQQQWSQFMNPERTADSKPEKDRRFRHDLWQDSPFYDGLKQQYKLNAKLIDETLASASETLDDRQAKLVEFYGRQWRDALSPSNYPWSNPEVMEQAMETNGESLISGLNNLLHDLDQGRITMAPLLQDCSMGNC